MRATSEARISKREVIREVHRLKGRISINARLVLAFLASRMDAPNANGVMRRSRPVPLAWLAEEIEKTERTARSAVDELLGLNLVRRQRTGREARYELDVRALFALSEGKPDPVPEGPGLPLWEEISGTSLLLPYGEKTTAPVSPSAPMAPERAEASGGEPAVEEDVAGKHDLADGLRSALKTYSGEAKAKKAVREPSAEMAAAYVSCRRDFDPLYEAPRSLGASLLKAEAGLRLRRVPEADWPAYVRWCFERFEEIRKAPSALPPNLLHSDWFLDNYSAARPARKLDTRKARELLRARGYSGLVSAAVEVALAIRDGREPPGWKAETQEAGRWLAERLDEIGTVEVGE